MQKVLDSDGNRVKLATMGTNGRLHYGQAATREEPPHETKRREVFWRSLGKKIRKGAVVKS